MVILGSMMDNFSNLCVYIYICIYGQLSQFMAAKYLSVYPHSIFTTILMSCFILRESLSCKCNVSHLIETDPSPIV